MKTREKILVAGSSGFLGKILTNRLIKKGFSVVKGGSEKFDFRDLKDCVKATRGISTAVIAAGVITSRRDQEKHPADILFTNALIDLNFLEACRLNKVPEIIFIGSIVAYNPDAKSPLKETELLKNITPKIDGKLGFYNLSKWLTIPSSLAYANQYGLRVRIIILPSFYGPNGKFGHKNPPLVPNLIIGMHKALKNNSSFNAGSGPNKKIDLLYIDDASSAVQKVLENFGKEPFKIINFGSGRAYLFKDICAIIAKNLNFRGKILWSDKKSSPSILLDNQVSHKIGWCPQIGIEEGLKKTVGWFLETRSQKYGKK
jgi:GDP-L-fucose synthase